MRFMGNGITSCYPDEVDNFISITVLKEVDESEDDDKARTMFTEASRLLRRSRLPYLRVADRNTTGLHDRHWRALVKMQGASVKEKRGAGGSHGIGKNAPFAVSPLRTVYYWTRFGEGDRSVEQFQGKPY